MNPNFFSPVQDIYDEINKAVDSIHEAREFVRKHTVNFRDPKWGQTLLHFVLKNIVGALSNTDENGQLPEETLNKIRTRQDVANYLIATAHIDNAILDNEGRTAADIAADKMVNWTPIADRALDDHTIDNLLARDILFNLNIGWTEQQAQIFENKGYQHSADVVRTLIQGEQPNQNPDV